MTPILRFGALVSSLSMAALAAAAPPPPPEPQPPTEPEASSPAAVNAELFYELLLGEISAHTNDPGMGFSLMLDAARKTGDPALYKRSVEIALQAHAGESALQAARAWKKAEPQSREANRYVLQILLALNRIGDTLGPLKTELRMAPASELGDLLSVVPRLYARASDKKQAATVVEEALADYLDKPDTAAAAWTAIGRARLNAGNRSGALAAARKAHALAPNSEGPTVLALALMNPRTPEAEAMVRRYLAGDQPMPELRLAYARALLEDQRFSEAEDQLRETIRQRPQLAPAWLLLGQLELDIGRPQAAEDALKRYLELGEDETSTQGRDEAYLALAQVAQRRKNLDQANAWLGKIQDPQELASAQVRRASILAQQGHLQEGLKLLHELPERTPTEARRKLMAEVQLLRENQQYKAARDLLAKANAKEPVGAELLYDWAMISEQLGDHAEAERLLRKAIQRKPDFAQAYNALGYSMANRRVRLPEAKRLIQKALELQPGDPFITDSLAWVEYRMGHEDEALRLLEQAFRRRPDPEIAAHMGEVLWGMGQRERAQAIWKEGLSIDRENETLQQTLKRLHVDL